MSQPSEISARLRHIAARIDRSVRPDRTLVARELRQILAAMEPKQPLNYLVLLNDDSADSHDFCGSGGDPGRSQELTEEVLSAVGDLQNGEFAGMAADGEGHGRWIQFLAEPGKEDALKIEVEQALSAKFPDGWPLGGEWSR